MTFLSHLGLNLARWLLGLMLLAVALPASNALLEDR
jgi:hypothetical protein